MVDFTKFDISILLTMTLAIVVMSFLFPALGMSSAQTVQESDVPGFNVTQNTFDITGELPEQPRTSDTGTLTLDEDGAGNSVEGISLLYIDSPEIEGFSIEVANVSTGPRVTAINWSDTDNDQVAEVETQNDYSINNDTSQTILHNDNGYVIEFNVESIDNYEESNMSIVMSYDIQSSPEDSDGISALPIIGSTADLLATVIGYLVTMFSYVALVLVEVAINTLVTTALVSGYLVQMGIFLVSTYANIVASASSWAAIILVVPSVLLAAEFAKIAYLIIKAFPTT